MKWFGLVLTVLCLSSGCEKLEKPCTEACSRPFELGQSRGEQQITAWSEMPASLKAKTASISDAWKQEMNSAKNNYLGQCVSSCQKYATASEIECRRRAGNLGEWKRCGK